MNDKHNTEGQNKSKFKFLTTNSETRRSAKPSYLYKLPKEQARAIFMARTRMIKVKTNYKNMYTNTMCRGCGLKEETQQHVLEECTSIHTQDNLKTPTNQLFSNDPTTTKSTTNKLTTLLKKWEHTLYLCLAVSYSWLNHCPLFTGPCRVEHSFKREFRRTQKCLGAFRCFFRWICLSLPVSEITADHNQRRQASDSYR